MNNHPPVFDGGHLALDFLNSVASPDGERPDHLAAPASFLSWMEAAGLAADGELAPLRASPPEARLLLAHAVRLRDAVSGIVRSLAEGLPASREAVLEVNRILPRRKTSPELVVEPDGYRLAPVGWSDGPLGLLAPVAEAAAELLVHGDPTRLRRCHAPGCALWFLDTSRNGRRRWCSMARCGNRAKVAAHYRRQQAR